MAFKIFALVCLVGVVCVGALPEPAPRPSPGGTSVVGGVLDGVGDLLGGVLDGVSGLVKGLLCNKPGATVNLGLNLQGLLRALAGGLTNIGGLANTVLRDLSQLKIPATLDDTLNLVTGVGATLGGVLDALIPGLKKPVSNLVLGLVKVLICTVGSPGLTGSLLGDKRPGLNNPSDIPAVCKADYGKKYGMKPYTGSYKDSSGVYNFYELGDLANQIRKILEKKTSGKGLSSLTASQQYIAKVILELSDLAQSRGCNGEWSEEDTIKIFTDISKLLGALGNSYRRNLGKRLVQQLFRYYKASSKNTSYFKQVNWSKYEKQISKEVCSCNWDRFNGAVIDESEDSYNNTENDKDVEYCYGNDSRDDDNRQDDDSDAWTDNGHTDNDGPNCRN